MRRTRVDIFNDAIRWWRIPTITALLVCSFFFTTDDAYAGTVSWATATIESSVTASSTRVLWDSSADRFAVGYVLSDGTKLKFATSTAGSSWSAAVTALSSSNLSTSDVFFTTSWSGGGNYIMFGNPTASNQKYLASGSGGSTWTSTDLTTLDRFINGAVQATETGNTYIVGRIQVGDAEKVASASTTANPISDVFVSSTVASVASAPTVDFAYHPTNGVAVFSLMGSGTVGVVTSTNMAAWTDHSFTPPGSYTAINRPRVKFDKNGKFYILYVAADNGGCSVKCDVLLSSYAAGTWTTEIVDSVGASGAFSTDADHDLGFINGVTPIISYYNASTGYVRYAIKDSGNSGCSGSDGSAWTCGDVTSVSMAPTLAMTTNNSTTAVIVYQSGMTTFVSAYGTYSTASSATTLSALPKPIKPTNGTLVVNSGYATTKNLDIPVEVSAKNATEVAISTNPDFFGVAWQPIGGKKIVHLQNKTDTQYVYAKFTNATGGVSDTIFDDITFVPLSVETPVATAPMVATPTTSVPTEPSVSVPAQSNGGIVKENPTAIETVYQYFVIDDGVNPFSTEGMSSEKNGTIVSVVKPLCPERPNAFSLGGTVVRERTGALFLLLKSQRVVCPIPSNAVLRSWGATARSGSAKGYRISSPLPYRPGTLVQNTTTRERYFVNTKGRLQKLPSQQQYWKLGYKRNQIFFEYDRVLKKYPQSPMLTRADIHPDGTLFLLDAKKREYAMLQNRELHPISFKTLMKFHEIPSRSVKLLRGEKYPFGVRWE